LSRSALSVVIPFRDEADYLDEALRSLSEQTLEDFEVVMVDDHSQDGSTEIAREWQRSDPRFRVLASEGRGIVDSLNTGLRAAGGEWIARFDADDVCLPERLELQLDMALRLGPGHVVSCLVESFPRERVSTGFRAYERWLNSLRDPEQLERNIFRESPIPHPSAVYSRRAVLGAGGYRSVGVPEDYELWLRLWKLGKRFRKYPRVLLRWRERPDRLSRTDPRYSLSSFYRLKAMYVRFAPAVSDGRVVVWGSGQTGRRLSKWLDREGLSVVAFVDVAEGRIGSHLRGAPIVSPEELPTFSGIPVLVASRGLGAREEICSYLDCRGYRNWLDYVVCA
jgi:cellulose synthase/poly-beta-1,6-N-acetylglucosamine synthase-like glycosyltransferase